MNDGDGIAGGAIQVGIDFGTTHTIVVLADSGNYPVLKLPFEYDGETLVREYIPSCITFHENETYYGPGAVECYLRHHRQGAIMLRSIKRMLQDWYEGLAINLLGVEIPVEALLTQFLIEIKQAIMRALDAEEQAIEAVIAVPANASSSQRFVTLNCFRKAGFRVLRILDEPCASGIQFVRERYKRWDRVEADVIIYDLGGGTFDTTMLSIRRGIYDPVLTRGISRLGGDDFDQVLLELVETELGRDFDTRERIHMLQVVREVKENIGPYSQKLYIDTPDGMVSIPIKVFLDQARPLMEKTIDLVERVLAETVTNIGPDRIVLVGGGPSSVWCLNSCASVLEGRKCIRDCILSLPWPWARPCRRTTRILRYRTA